MHRRLPVTLVGGFLGSGKTSLLHHLISGHEGGHLAVLVENPGALNLDAGALRGLCGSMRRLYDTVLEIPNVDEEAQVEWIAGKLKEFSESGRYERVLIEVAGTSNPARFGRYFGLMPGQSAPFAPWAELHQVICVVDALDFYRTMKGPLSDVGPRRFQQVQMTAATLLVLNKCDLVTEAEREECTRWLQGFKAPWVETAYGEVPAEIWSQPTPQMELGRATQREMKPVQGGPVEEWELSPLTSVIYRAYRPFHPGRFWRWFNADHPGLLRVKGLIWLASRNLLVGGISRTRWQNACGSAGIWWAALPREEWPGEPETLMRMQETWREPYGDRRQELVLIGNAAQLDTIARLLNNCLLSAEEYARPVQEWASFPDPFPAWDLDGTE